MEPQNDQRQQRHQQGNEKELAKDGFSLEEKKIKHNLPRVGFFFDERRPPPPLSVSPRTLSSGPGPPGAAF
jgi:hypothetical protein